MDRPPHPSRLHRLSEHAVSGALAVACVGAAPLVWSLADATPPESMAAPRPGTRDTNLSYRAVTPIHVLSRLDEVRWKFRAIHADELDAAEANGVSGPPGSAAEIDRMLGELAADHARAARAGEAGEGRP